MSIPQPAESKPRRTLGAIRPAYKPDMPEPEPLFSPGTRLGGTGIELPRRSREDSVRLGAKSEDARRKGQVNVAAGKLRNGTNRVKTPWGFGRTLAGVMDTAGVSVERLAAVSGMREYTIRDILTDRTRVGAKTGRELIETVRRIGKEGADKPVRREPRGAYRGPAWARHITQDRRVEIGGMVREARKRLGWSLGRLSDYMVDNNCGDPKPAYHIETGSMPKARERAVAALTVLGLDINMLDMKPET